MIFLGDIASPILETTYFLDKILSEYDTIFHKQRIICNFEGLISNEVIKANKPILWNNPLVPEILNRGREPVLCMANNHILDLPEKFGYTIKLLKEKNIKYCGSGLSLIEAERPATISESKNRVAVFNYCWDFLLYNQKNPSKGVYVATINEEEIIKKITSYKKVYPDLYIVVYLHWNLDLEILPFPVHRKFSKDLINAGANIVVGSHSHCVQGGEKYKNGYIIYGLGNFFIPYGYYANGKVTYPEIAKLELALEWDPITNEAYCHWFKYEKSNGKHNLKLIKSEKFDNSDTLMKFSPYSEMNDSDYVKFYKKNRRKKFLIPVYVDYRKKRKFNFYTFLLKKRAKTAHLLAKINIIKWQK